jgi:uncharacterized membrane protein HdeD (DUF308 family)
MNENIENPAWTPLAGAWWLLALRGFAAIAFGILAFVWPHLTLLTLVFLFGAYAIVNGVLEIVQAFSGPKGSRSAHLALQGIVSLLAGIVAFFMPGLTMLALLILIAAWAIVGGIFEIVAAIKLRKIIEHEWLLVLTGILSVLFGLALIIHPAASAVVLVWWVGGFAVVFGILLVSLAFRVRSWRGLTTAAV